MIDLERLSDLRKMAKTAELSYDRRLFQWAADFIEELQKENVAIRVEVGEHAGQGNYKYIKDKELDVW